MPSFSDSTEELLFMAEVIKKDYLLVPLWLNRSWSLFIVQLEVSRVLFDSRQA
jgi:hypothetical protein